MQNITLHPSNSRGIGGADWLDSRFSFSFADYYDPKKMGFRNLRVINEDHVAPGAGFPMHPHKDMEIITYVLEGALAHKDSLGSGAVLKPGELQRMSAGTGIVHSEFNASKDTPVHLLQIWIMPEKRGGEPAYAQQPVDQETVKDKFGLIASRDGRQNTVSMRQDADLWLAKLSSGTKAAFDVREGRGAWVQVARGAVALNGEMLKAGDAASVDDAGMLEFTAAEDSEILLFDMK